MSAERLTIFLSASVPSPKRADQFRRIGDAAFEIEQAVISLARAVFTRGGRLVFGGHPSISPLVGVVAGEYRAPRVVEGGEGPAPASVVIYQSEAFRGQAQEDKLLLFKLDLAEVHWIPAVDGERFDPAAERDGPPCPKSVAAMRERLLEEAGPDAMVCIGGMEGVIEEAKLFRRRFESAPIFVLNRTGGAAAILGEDTDLRTEMIDEIVARDLEERSEGRRASDATREGDGPPASPYPLIMQTIVETLWPEPKADRRG